jgi:hypothetical protein
VTVNLESTYDWKGEDWNVPLNATYSKVTRRGSQTLSYAGGVRYFIETPGDGPDWGVRFVITLLFPVLAAHVGDDGRSLGRHRLRRRRLQV